MSWLCPVAPVFTHLFNWLFELAMAFSRECPLLSGPQPFAIPPSTMVMCASCGRHMMLRGTVDTSSTDPCCGNITANMAQLRRAGIT